MALALGDYLKIRSHACIGGTVIRDDLERLREGQQLIVGTPGLNAGMGISAMNQAQQAAQVQAKEAALALQRSNIWTAGLQRLADDTEYARQRDAELFNIAHLNDPNVIQAQKRNMLLNAGKDRVDPQIAAHHFLTS